MPPDYHYYAYTANHAPDDARDTVVFVHGAAMDHSVWSQQSRYFAYHGYNVLAVDLPGHHRSLEALLDDIGAMGKWLGGIIAKQRGRGFHLVGHSMGALIALEAAAHYSHNDAPLCSLSLLGFAYPMKVAPQLLDAARDNPPAAHAMMTHWSYASKIGGEPLPGFWSPGMQLSMMANNPRTTVFADLRACNKYAGGEAAFAKTACPIMFICGAQDKMAPAKLARTFIEKHAGENYPAEVVMLENCGHSLMAESPHGVLRALTQFIARHQTAAN